MKAIMRQAAMMAVSGLLLTGLSWAQTSSIAGVVKGEDGKGLKDALVKIERKDIKGNYKVKTNKKGEYFHAGLPLGVYKITLEVGGRDVDQVDNVRTRLGDPTEINFDLQQMKARRDAMQKAAETGQLSQEQMREMSPEQRAAMEKQLKERQQQLAKNKELNAAFNEGMEALKTKNFEAAVQGFTKASELDPKQHVVWGNMAEAYMGLGGQKTGAEQEAAFTKAMEAYGKAIELNPSDAAYHNNYALALARQKKFAEAQAELEKAAQLNPPGAGQYYYNLGAVLVNTGQIEPAGEAFKKAIEADPNYANAQYQYGVYLVSKATTTPDGKIVPPPGTKEAFEKYLQLDPSGPFADAAKGMLSSMEATVQTEYTNPDAKKKGGKRK
ncbi:MAG: tetratricopeptide repeat protein [Bryobacteraceae bacterium]|nr:tetratricopeptide repeat protein [Bryobacterales bacterium]MEB2363701.1 tetratricopeptide repeat protein [Bryobacterales bacterium]NUN01604.1 tetratricopeptide repeat protein [Bryobacteraceae bacterium]